MTPPSLPVSRQNNYLDWLFLLNPRGLGRCSDFINANFRRFIEVLRGERTALIQKNMVFRSKTNIIPVHTHARTQDRNYHNEFLDLSIFKSFSNSRVTWQGKMWLFFLFCAAYNTYSMWVQDSRGQWLNNNCLRFSFKLEEKASAWV